MKEKKWWGKKKMWIWLIFWIYMGVMIYFLFLGERYGNPYHEYHYNLVLFHEIRRFIMYRHTVGTVSFLLNIFGNVFAFSPFGFLLPVLSTRMRRFWKMLLLSFFLTLCIECIQLVTMVGVFDVDDIFMNTLGGAVGYLAYALVYRWYVLRKGEAHGV